MAVCLTSFHGWQMRVWDLETLECEHVLKQPDGVWALVAVEEAVLGGVGAELVVWGRSACGAAK